MGNSLSTQELVAVAWPWIKLLPIIGLTWIVGEAGYNVYFHPLSRFPGPRMAAATVWWKVYLELVKQESLALKLWDLHAKYGDIVRIGPNELHFSNPAAYNDIHSQRNRWTKDPYLYACFAIHESTFSICEYDRAKKRRDIITPLFSRKAVLNTQHVVQECFDAMCENIEIHVDSNIPVNIFRAFRCTALENIFSMCFARSMGTTRAPEFRAQIERAMYAALPVSILFKHFPGLKHVMEWVPEGIIKSANPVMEGYFEMRAMLRSQIKEVLAHPEKLADWPRPTIYHEFLASRDVPGEQSLRDEALLFVNAGTDTISDTLSVGTLNILGNPAIYKRLCAELTQAWPNLEDRPRYEDLENLPYLRAVIKESLRTSHGVVTPMTRVVPSNGALIAGTQIPGGTVVGISNTFVHWNESIFPNAREFDPERWLGDDAGALDTYLVAFCKGPRSCLGINLAWCELYIGFANIFRRFDLSLDGFSPKDLRWRDCYLPHFDEPETEMMLRVKRRTT